ncbi:MAG: BatA domain-containing protein [Phycisphaeraceae bacterium]
MPLTPTLAQFGALFTVPGLAAAGAAAVSIPIIIHLLYRMRRRPEPWGAMRFLMLAYRRHRQRLRFEQLLLLVTRCLLVLILGLALAGPVLTGCQGWLGGLDARGRSVHLVIDDALSTQAEDATGEARAEQLRATALALTDALRASDRVTLWRAGRPGERVVEAETDRAALREAIENLEPGYARPDMVTTLEQVAESLAREGVSPGSADVVLLSDFSRAARYLDEPASAALRGLGERAGVWAARPSGGAANVQIASLRPRRSLVVVDQAEATVPVAVQLRRFGPVLEAASVDVELTLLDGEGQAVERVRRSQRFAEGQSTATVNVSLPVPESAKPQAADGAVTLVVHGRVDAGRLGNALAADDERLAVVEVRRRLSVALVDERGAAAPENGLRPVQWLLLGLAPFEAGSGSDGGSVGLELYQPGEVSRSVLDEHDAVMVLRPDGLSDEAWGELAAYVERGGLAWVFTPAVETPAVWATAMQRVFDMDWQLAMEPAEQPAEASGWTLSGSQRAPEALSLLSADWEALLRPVRVYRRLPLEAPENQRWLTVSGAVDGPALLAAHEHGQGTLMLLAAALDSEWSNLPAKPLFVPLLHESLRGVLGEARGRIVPGVVAGDRPTLGPPWRGIDQLTRTSAFGPTAVPEVDGDEPARLVLDEENDNEAAPLLRRPAQRPGVYSTPAEAAALKLAVNVDAEAGDTQAVDEEQLARWLSGLGTWQYLDADDPGAALRREAQAVNLGWPLLWVVLALLLFETLLARRFSHAYAGPRGSVASGLRRMVRYVRPTETLTTGQSVTRAAPRDAEPVDTHR